MELILILIGAYLIGSFNPAIWICQVAGFPDPRQIGSNNPGTTNVYRIAGKRVALLVLFLDIFKGVIPTWGSYYLGLEPFQIGLTAIAVCLGHMYPIFYRFNGGKAVATALGCMLPVGGTLGISLLAIWFIIFKLTGYSSLAAIVSVGISPVLTYFIAERYWLPVTMLAIFIILRHSPNIIRLLNGQEPKSKNRL